MRSSGNLVVASGFASRRGGREANEDYCGIWLGSPNERVTHGIVAAVADGVGGAKGGRIAAELAVRSFLDGYYAAPATLGVAGCAKHAMDAFNAWLYAMGRRDPAMEGAGTTFTALVLRGRRLHVLHVGDSRAWRFRDGNLVRLTEDHVLPQPELRHVLYRAVGLERQIRLDHWREELDVHDRLLLASDGVHGVLSDRAIARLLARRGSLEAGAQAIVDAALAAGSTDNATALVIDVIELPEPDFDSIAGDAAELPVLSPPAAGEEVDGFLLERLLSDGRYSRTFLARDRQGGGERALKFPKPAALSERGARLAFQREMLVGSRVQSPFVAELVPLPRERQSRLYVAQRFYRGHSLEQRLAEGPLPIASGLSVASRIARGVAALHRIGIVHRDIKPDNILLTDDGGVRLIDLGVARLPRVEEFDRGEIPGTPSFMAPELFDGDRGSDASDQFAFGVTLYRMFTGRYPYGEIEAFSRPRFTRPLRPESARPDLPAWLGEAMVRAVSVRPEARFGDMIELVGVLEGGTSRAAPMPRPLSLYERDPLRFWQGLALALGTALLAVLAFR